MNNILPKLNQIGYFDPKLVKKKAKTYLVDTDKEKLIKCHFSENNNIELIDAINIGKIKKIRCLIYN